MEVSCQLHAPGALSPESCLKILEAAQISDSNFPQFTCPNEHPKAYGCSYPYVYRNFRKNVTWRPRSGRIALSWILGRCGSENEHIAQYTSRVVTLMHTEF